MKQISLIAFFSVLSVLLYVPHAAAETLTVSHGYSTKHFMSEHGVEAWMTCVSETGNNEIDFDYFPSGQIASVDNSLDAMNDGLAEVSTIAAAYLSNKIPLNGIALLPDMGDTATEMVTAYRAMLDAGGPIAEEFEVNDVQPLFLNLLPAYQLVSVVGPLETPEDLKGSKIRVSGGVTNMFVSAVGAVPVGMPAGDMYVALQRKTVDAALSAVASVKPYGVHELANAISSNGKFGSGSTILAIDQGSYDNLSAGYKQVVDDCGLKVEMELAQRLDDENEALKVEFAASGIDIYEISEEASAVMLEDLLQVSEEYVNRLEDRGLPAREVYNAYRAVLNK